jgi:hypothetical protein
VDTYFSRAFGFTYNDFMNASSSNMNNHVEYGIKPYLDERIRTAQVQMPELVTGVETDLQIAYPFPNPASFPEFRYHSTTADTGGLVVYRADGTTVPVMVYREDDQTIRISLPPASPQGIYFFRSQGRVTKWVLR